MAEFDRGTKLGGYEEFLGANRVLTALASRDRREIDKQLAALPERRGEEFSRVRVLVDNPAAALLEVRRLGNSPTMQNSHGWGVLSSWAAFYGDPELALGYLMDKARDTNDAAVLWRPLLRDVRKLPGFKPIVRQAGLVEYWDAYGWSKFCKRTTADDFECG